MQRSEQLASLTQDNGDGLLLAVLAERVEALAER